MTDKPQSFNPEDLRRLMIENNQPKRTANSKARLHNFNQKIVKKRRQEARRVFMMDTFTILSFIMILFLVAKQFA